MQQSDPAIPEAVLVLESGGFLSRALEAAEAALTQAPPDQGIDQAKVLREATTWMKREVPENPYPQRQGDFISLRLLRPAAPARVAGRLRPGYVEAQVRGTWQSWTPPNPMGQVGIGYWLLFRTEDWSVARFEQIPREMPEDAAPPWR
jgi:hypothetical protein